MVLDNNSLYFSDEYDLTNSFQGFIDKKSTRKEYMYNESWIKTLMEIDAKEWVTIFISGYVSIKFIRFSD
jgi:methionine salvage enolase-phosphatase E1